MLASLYGHLPIVKYLAPLSDVNNTNEKGESALYLSAKNNQEAVVEMLYIAGADPTLMTTVSDCI